MARQGPHQAAQKSTMAGISDFKISCSKSVSLTCRSSDILLSCVGLAALAKFYMLTAFCQRLLEPPGSRGPPQEKKPGPGIGLWRAGTAPLLNLGGDYCRPALPFILFRF